MQLKMQRYILLTPGAFCHLLKGTETFRPLRSIYMALYYNFCDSMIATSSDWLTCVPRKYRKQPLISSQLQRCCSKFCTPQPQMCTRDDAYSLCLHACQKHGSSHCCRPNFSVVPLTKCPHGCSKQLCQFACVLRLILHARQLRHCNRKAYTRKSNMSCC